MPQSPAQHGSLPATIARAVGAFVVAAMPIWAQSPAPGLRFESTLVDLGESFQFGVLEHEIRFANESDREIQLGTVSAADERGSATTSVQTVEPGGEGTLALTQPLGHELGLQSFRFRVETDDSASPQVIELLTFVQSAYDVEYPRIDFGDVNAITGKSAEIEIATREAPTLAFERVVQAPEWVTVTAGPDDPDDPQKVTLKIQIEPGAPFGWRTETVHVRTDLAVQRDHVIPLFGSIFGDVVPTVHPIVWGAVRQGEPRTMSVQLVSRGGNPVTIERIEESTGRLQVETGPCSQATSGPSCRQLDMTLDSTQQGGFRGQLNVFVAGLEQPLPLTHSGLVASPDARIQELGEIGDGTRINRSGATVKQP